MFSNNRRENGSESSAVTIIGPGTCVRGNIAFSGYLRVQGNIVGDIACDSDSRGTTVVHGAGSVTGAIKAPNIVVGGLVHGPLHASDSVEIHEGASVVGDTCYRQLSIQVGASIDGSLIPTASSDNDRPRLERRIAAPDSPAVKELDGPHAHDRRSTDRFRNGRKLGIAAALVAAFGVVVWIGRMPRAIAPAEVAVAPKPDSSTKNAPVAPPEPTKVEAPPVAPAASAAPIPPVDQRNAESNKVVTVQGTDPDKPAGVFFVNTKEPSVLLKKRRNDPADGTRIDLSQGARKRIAIAENEMVQVIQGRDVEIFYQGRKVSPTSIESGNWISFIPLATGGTTQ